MPRPASRRLRVRYLLEGSGLHGGVKVVLAQANLLTERGHEITVVSREPAPDWYPLQAAFVHVDRLDGVDLPDPDLIVATFWTTIAPALRSRRPVLHYCQGYEGGLGYDQETQADIARTYAEALPAMAVSPHLVALLRHRFDRPARLVPPLLEDFWRPSPAPFDCATVPRVLVVGAFEIPLKGIDTALRAVDRLRSSGFDAVLVRLSPTPVSEDERRLLAADEFHHRLPPCRAADLFRSVDLLLAPSREPEGFGLPVLEAMGSGVPVVASDVSCFRGFAADAAVLVPPDDAASFAGAAIELLSDRALWLRRRQAGLATAARFTSVSRVTAIEEALEWAADGGWR